MKIVLLHGFLGSPHDWDEVVCALPSMYDCTTLGLTREEPQWDTTSIVAGYSMGGRIALQKGTCAGLVLIGAHFGLSKEEKQKRCEEENQWKELLLRSPEEFLQKWYQQPLFAGSSGLIERRKSINPGQQATLLDRYSIIKQPLLTPPENAIFLYGERDEKYKKLYSALMNAHAIPNAGHAAHLDNPLAVAQMIEHYVETIYASRTRNIMERSGNL